MVLQEGVVFVAASCAVFVCTLGAGRPLSGHRRLAPSLAYREEGGVEEMTDVNVGEIFGKVVE